MLSGPPKHLKAPHINYLRTLKDDCGSGWIRTIVGVCQQIYSLPPLATRARYRDRPPTWRYVKADQKAQSWRQDLNPQPVDYKSTALPVELRQRKEETSEKSRP